MNPLRLATLEFETRRFELNYDSSSKSQTLQLTYQSPGQDELDKQEVLARVSTSDLLGESLSHAHSNWTHYLVNQVLGIHPFGPILSPHSLSLHEMLNCLITSCQAKERLVGALRILGILEVHESTLLMFSRLYPDIKISVYSEQATFVILIGVNQPLGACFTAQEWQGIYQWLLPRIHLGYQPEFVALDVSKWEAPMLDYFEYFLAPYVSAFNRYRNGEKEEVKKVALKRKEDSVVSRYLSALLIGTPLPLIATHINQH